MREKIALTLEEARLIFGPFGARLASIGLCAPRVGKCLGAYIPTSETCKVCRKVGAFLGYRFEEE